MKISTYTVKSHEYKPLLTDLMYNISSARALNFDLLQISFNEEDIPLIVYSRVERILKSFKKQLFIKYYVSPEHWRSKSEEFEYLVNKFPEIPALNTDDEQKSYFVKL